MLVGRLTTMCLAAGCSTGCGDLVDTWQASLGLKNEFEGEKRYNQWQIDIPKEVWRQPLYMFVIPEDRAISHPG